MRLRSIIGLVSAAALVASCGGGGGSSGSGSVSVRPAPTPTPAPAPSTAAACSLEQRQQWVFDQLDEWYLFPTLLDRIAPDPVRYPTLNGYVDALTATARARGFDRGFTYVTSIAEEDAYYDSGESAGYGFRLGLDATRDALVVIESFEGSPATDTGIDRGDAITAVGTSATNLRDVGAILASEGIDGLIAALGPDEDGVRRYLRVTNASGTRVVTITKRAFDLLPVSPRYGARVIEDRGRRIGYLNLRTFISTADPALRTAFADFRAQGITEFIIDFRYNGGGLISTAELLTNLLGGGRTNADILARIAFSPNKSSENETIFFTPQPESVTPTRIAFIGTGSTASASELVINSLTPYVRDIALIGANTFGKPVGQVALDRPECDDRLRAVALEIQNASGQGSYYQGLARAGTLPTTCQARDDLAQPLGDRREASIAQALAYLAGESCTPIGGTAMTTQALGRSAPMAPAPLLPERPTPAQRDQPGLF